MWSTKFHKDGMLVCLISLLRHRLIMFLFIFQNNIRAHIRHEAFATLQIELYRVVDYDRRWSTKFRKDCKLDFLNFTFKTSFYIYFLIFKIVLGSMSGTQLLVHSKLNCSV